jgi:hypothetical protein
LIRSVLGSEPDRLLDEALDALDEDKASQTRKLITMSQAICPEFTNKKIKKMIKKMIKKIGLDATMLTLQEAVAKA